MLGSPVTEPAIFPFVAPALLPKSARSLGLQSSWVTSYDVSSQVVLVDPLVVALGALCPLLHFLFLVLLNVLFAFTDASCGEVTLLALPELHLVRLLVVHVHLLRTSILLSTFPTREEHTHVHYILVSFQSDISC